MRFGGGRDVSPPPRMEIQKKEVVKREENFKASVEGIFTSWVHATSAAMLPADRGSYETYKTRELIMETSNE